MICYYCGCAKCSCQKNAQTNACSCCHEITHCSLCGLCVPAIHLLEDSANCEKNKSDFCRCFLSDSEEKSNPQTNPDTPGTSSWEDTGIPSSETRPEQPTKIMSECYSKERDSSLTENLPESSDYALNSLPAGIKSKVRNLKLAETELGAATRNINEYVTEREDNNNFIKEDNNNYLKELEENSSRDVKEEDNSFGYAGDVDYSDDDFEKNIKRRSSVEIRPSPRQISNNLTMQASEQVISSTEKVDIWLRESDFVGNIQNEEKSSSSVRTSVQDLQFDEDNELGRSDPPTSYRGRVRDSSRGMKCGFSRGNSRSSNRRNLAFEGDHQSSTARWNRGSGASKNLRFTADQKKIHLPKTRNHSFSKRKNQAETRRNDKESTGESSQNTEKGKNKSPKKRNKQE